MRDIVLGDVGGAILAFLAIALLQMRSRLGLLLAAILVVETAYDTVTNIHGGMQEHLLGAASGPTWFILAFYVPAVVVSAVLIAWQLLSRYREPLIASMADKGGRQGSLSLLGLHRVSPTFARLILPLGAGLLATSALARVASRSTP